MKNLNHLRFFYLLICMIASTVFVGCVDDNDDTEAPYLTVTPTTLTFSNSGEPAEGSQAYFEISTNRHWTATVQDNKTWVTLSSYEGDNSARIQVSIPAGINEEANILIQISNKVGPLKSETVTIKSGQIVPSVVIFNTNVGDQAVSSAAGWPFADAYTDWNATGLGASSVTFGGRNASIRTTGNANTGSYDGASGPNVVFFGTAPASLLVNTISLTSAQTNLKLTFGASYSFRDNDGVYDNNFPVDQFIVSLSADGSTWTPLSYTKNNGDETAPNWILATSDFTLSEAVGNLYIKFEAQASSVFRLDDITLATGNGGTVITLSGGTTPPGGGETGQAEVITIPDINSLMTTAGAVIDANNDRYFEAIVQNDVAGGNYSFNNLIVATEGATTANNGVTLYGSQVEPTTLGLNKGDRIKVTLKKGLAQAKNYNGLMEITGGKDEAWVEIEKLASGVTITPTVITPSQLSSYQAMTVTIQNAAPEKAGVWAVSTGISSHSFVAGGTTFTVFCKKDATSFLNENYVVTTGSISGIASVNSNNGQLVPRDMADVIAFSSADPIITGATPSSVSFPSEGGTKTVEVAVSNQGSNTLSVSGLSGILSATIDNSTNVVTITATENTADTAENQTLTITLSGYNSITVPVTVAAAGGSASEGYTLISTANDITAGTYMMAGYVSASAPYDYQVWTGATSADGSNLNTNSDLVTVPYSFASGELTPQTASDAVTTEVQLVAVDGKANTYYIMVNGKYLYNSVATTNRRLFFTDNAAEGEWLFENKTNGDGICPSNNGTWLMTAAASFNYLRSYKTETQNATGVFFFKKN